jgi:hypothetical protein
MDAETNKAQNERSRKRMVEILLAVAVIPLLSGVSYGQDRPCAIVEIGGNVVLASDDNGLEKETMHSLEGFWIPVLSMQADIDSDEPGGGVEFEADVESGPGWGLRYDFHKSESDVTIGAMYMGTTHTERITDRDVDIHSAYVTASGDFELTDYLSGRVTAGAGGVVVDFSEGFDDTGGGALLISGGLGFTIIENLRAGVDVGGFLWGYPGETIAYGGFCTFGLAYRF